jgi:Protein of unknown function (DUF3631)
MSNDDLLDRLHASLTRFVVFPSVAAAHAVTLWIAATHAIPSWQHATRLVITSPEKRCGKSRLLDVIEATANTPLVTANATPSAIFRSLHETTPPTLLIDEADAMFTRRNGSLSERAEELRGLLNAGFQRGRPMLRCVGPQQTPTPFPTFAMAAVAGIGKDMIPDTILDRAVVVEMRRRGPGETIQAFRHRRDDGPLRQLGAEIAAWIREHRGELANAIPELPLEDRAADTWEPLVAVADLAGNHWPERARTAAIALTTDDAAEQSLSLRLLADLRDIFDRSGRPALASAAIIEELKALPEAPWGAFDFTQRDLARRLRAYDVRSGQFRPDGGGQLRGYRREHLDDPWTRYLPAEASRSVTPSQTLWDNAERRDGQNPVTDASVTDPEPSQAEPNNGNGCDDVTDRDASPGDDDWTDDLRAAIADAEQYEPVPDDELLDREHEIIGRLEDELGAEVVDAGEPPF